MQARQAAAEAVAAGQELDQDKDTAPVVEQRTPQAVIDKLFSARGELDVIFDLIAAVEQQQFVSLSHVPTAKNPRATAQQAALRLAHRREQLRSTADRIRTGTAAARQQAAIADRFLQDLKEIRKEWRLCRRTTARGGNIAGSFYVDLSLPIEKTNQILLGHNRGSASARTQVNLVPSAEGAACIVVPVARAARDGVGDGDGEGGCGVSTPPAAAAHPSPVKVIKGPQSISEELQRRHAYHSWQVTETLLSQEAKKISGTSNLATGGAAAAAVDAILRMAAIAAAKREETMIAHNKKADVNGEDIIMVDVEDKEVLKIEHENTLSSSVHHSAKKGFAAKDIEAYCRTPNSQVEFESRALRCLAALCREAQTPAIIKETRGGEVASIVEQLTGWLAHAALCYAVQHSLTRQTSEFPAVTVTTTTVSEGTEKKWVVSKDSRSLGIVAVESGRVRWYGPALLGITGQGQELGRAQLETFIEKVDLQCS